MLETHKRAPQTGLLRGYNRREVLIGACFVAPALIYMLLMVGYPLVYNIGLSLQNLDVMTFRSNNTTFQGLGNYIKLMNDRGFVGSMNHTLLFTIGCLLFQFTIGFAMALFFSKQFPLGGPIRGAILISYMIPMSVTGLLWKNLFNTDVGIFNFALTRLMIIKEPIPWLIEGTWAMWALIIANSWVGIPFNMLLLTAGLTNIPAEVNESAAIDGANVFQRFWHITVPLLRSAILSVLMLGFIYTFKVFDLVITMTGGGPNDSTQMMSTYAYRLSFIENQFSLGATGGVVLFLFLLIVGIFYLGLIRKEESA